MVKQRMLFAGALLLSAAALTGCGGQASKTDTKPRSARIPESARRCVDDWNAAANGAIREQFSFLYADGLAPIDRKAVMASLGADCVLVAQRTDTTEKMAAREQNGTWKLLGASASPADETGSLINAATESAQAVGAHFEGISQPAAAKMKEDGHQADIGRLHDLVALATE